MADIFDELLGAKKAAKLQVVGVNEQKLLDQIERHPALSGLIGTLGEIGNLNQLMGHALEVAVEAEPGYHSSMNPKAKDLQVQSFVDLVDKGRSH